MSRYIFPECKLHILMLCFFIQSPCSQKFISILSLAQFSSCLSGVREIARALILCRGNLTEPQLGRGAHSVTAHRPPCPHQGLHRRISARRNRCRWVAASQGSSGCSRSSAGRLKHGLGQMHRAQLTPTHRCCAEVACTALLLSICFSSATSKGQGPRDLA